MQVVIDANVVMSILISPGDTLDLFLKEELELFAPALLFEELERNKAVIIDKSRLLMEDIDALLAF